MTNLKKNLAEELSAAVRRIIPETALIRYEETKEGFFCDYAAPKPLNPALFKALSERTKDTWSDIPCELTHFSGVYEDGDASKRMLQRIYVTAFGSREEFDEYKAFLLEASLHDHKTLGQQLKLFSSSDEIGQGLILWHPKGAMLRHLLEKFGQEAHLLNDYQWVYSPHIGRAALWETSGHLDYYKDSMYNPIGIDGEEYYLKPMNCPFHIHIYNSQIRSYRELPMRLAEYGTVYRYELSGALNGLTRVRGFPQDDAHIICTDEQVEPEVQKALKFSLYILRSFGFENFEAYVSTKPKKKSVGDDGQWNRATDVLKNAVTSCGLAYRIDEGGGAFYGPKIDLKLRDSLYRPWQCSTIQFDFILPPRFEMSYRGNDGKKYTPFMVHRALFGSLERFTALLIEHYKGEFPFWLSPVQFGIVPVKESHAAYGRDLATALKKKGFRVSLGSEDNHMRHKIKAFELEKVPYMLIVGDQETRNSSCSVRSRKNGDLGEMTVDGLLEYLKDEISLGIPEYIFA
jgi:threonyl-tRNA synthetase